MIQIDCSYTSVHGAKESYTGEGVRGNSYGDGWIYNADFLSTFRAIGISGMSKSNLSIYFNDDWQNDGETWYDANLEDWLDPFNYGEFLVVLVKKFNYDYIPS